MLNVPAGFEVPKEVANKAIPEELRRKYKYYQIRPELIHEIMASHKFHNEMAANEQWDLLKMVAGRTIVKESPNTPADVHLGFGSTKAPKDKYNLG